MIDMMATAKSIFESGKYTCVIAKNDDLFTSTEKGIRPIIMLLSQSPDKIRDGACADKVIGKAAALLLVYGGIKEVFASVISRSALDFLTTHGIPTRHGMLVEFIKNRTGDGICPMEQRAVILDSPEQAFIIFSELILQSS